jgi:DNA polymerase III epsilon subunit-like protein
MIAAIFDTETSGLISTTLLPLAKQPKVIEFYGCTVDTETGAIRGELEFLCDPLEKLDPKVIEITGLKNEDLKGQPSFCSFEAKVRGFFEEADAAVAHNLSFDQEMINLEFKRCGSEMVWPRRMICTVQESEHYTGTRLRLTDLHKHLFGEPFEGAHRARVDVAALTRCFLEMVKRRDI